MRRYFLLSLVMVLALAPAAFASHGVLDNGERIVTATDVNYTGAVTVTEDGSVANVNIAPVFEEVTSTPNTIETSQGGTIFIATGSALGSKNFDLPSITTANDGLMYTFQYGGPGKNNAGVQIRMDIEPQDNASIFLTSKGTAGVSIINSYSAADCYPSVTLRAFGGNWYVTEIKGTWGTGS